jgi:hypothetical protein
VNERRKLLLLCLLLLLTLILLAFTAVQTVEGVRSFQRQTHALKVGDVSTIRPWMTIPTVSRIYHVPESYLYGALRISKPGSLSKATINKIAETKRQSVDDIIRVLQHAIETYRKEQPHPPTPVPTPTPTFHSERALHPLQGGMREA